MDFYGCHFEYAGEFSRKYGLIIAAVTATRNISVTGKSQSVHIFNKRNQTKSNLGSMYSEAPLVFEMEIIAEEPIDGEIRRKIQKWLFNQTDYQKLYLDRAEANVGEIFELVSGRPVRTYLNCLFVNPEKIEGDGGIMGYKFSVECDSRMAWQDPVRVSANYPGGETASEMITACVDTDTVEYTYPTIEINTGDIGGTIEITNLSDDPGRTTTFSDIAPNTHFTINGVYNYVSNGYYGNFINRNFPRLLDGTNEFALSGDITAISITWQNTRYL